MWCKHGTPQKLLRRSYSSDHFSGRGVPRWSGALRRIVAQREGVKGHRGESRVVASLESGQESSRVFCYGFPANLFFFYPGCRVLHPGARFAVTAKDGCAKERRTGGVDGPLSTATPMTHAH